MKPAFLTDAQLAQEFSARPGLIPIAIDSAKSQILWLDLDRYHCYEGFFGRSLTTFAALAPQSQVRFMSSVGALLGIDVSDSLAPSGFIFHAGRCGSTLLAQALGRSRENAIFSEAAPHNQVWKIIEGLEQRDIGFYRRLLLAMGRRRLQTYRAHFVKFTSYNLLKFAFIRAAFPATPALFLFRNPDAILASSAREAQPWLGMDIGFGQIWTDAAAATLDLCRAALAIRDPLFRCLDYADLTPRNLPAILRFFAADASLRDLALMEQAFAWDAKSGRNPLRFVPRETPTGLANQCLRDAYGALSLREKSDWNGALR